MKQRIALLFACVVGLYLVPAALSLEATVTKTVTVNTSASDFTVIAGVTNQSIRVSHVDVQNLGTSNKVSFRLCDGPCSMASSTIGPFELTPATTGVQGGTWSFAPCGGAPCYWSITPGNALIAQVDTGATNNVSVAVTYFLEVTVWTGTASSGILKATSQGVLTSAIPGTDYVTGSSTNTWTNKSLDCNATGNACSNIDLSADVTGVAGVANGGSGLSSVSADQIYVATAANTFAATSLPSCSNATTSKLLYNTTTHAFSCGTDQSGGGGGGGAATSLAPTVTTINAGNSPYTAQSSDFVLLCDTTAAARTINLPAATTAVLYRIKNLGANSCTINRAGSDTIDGGTSAVLTTQYEAIDLTSNGSTAWSVF